MMRKLSTQQELNRLAHCEDYDAYSRRKGDPDFTTKNGVVFDFYLTGPDGARFILFKTSKINNEQIKEAQSWLRQNYDVISTKTVTINERYNPTSQKQRRQTRRTIKMTPYATERKGCPVCGALMTAGIDSWICPICSTILPFYDGSITTDNTSSNPLLKTGLIINKHMELKPCPFCGKTELTLRRSTEDCDSIRVSLLCMNCGTIGPWQYITKPSLDDSSDYKEFVTSIMELYAVRLWNRRN